jgi:hypothetical protein
MKLFQTLLLSAVSLGLIPPAAVNALTVNVIDDLTTTQEAIYPTPLSSTVAIAEDDSGLFGAIDRSLDLTVENSPVTPVIQGNIPLSGSGNPGLSFSNGDDTNGLLTLSYDIASPTDFTQGGADRISIGFISSDLVGAAITVSLNGVNETVGPLDVAPPTQVLDFLFSSFDGIDPTAINSFSIVLDPIEAGDMSINVLETRDNTTTPEPSTILGLLAVGLTGRFLRKAKK